MPAKSKQQQKFFGVVKAMQKGDIPKKGSAGKVAKDMSKKDVDKYASTKHKGLPKKVKEDMVNEGKSVYRNNLLRVEILEHSKPVIFQEAEYQGRKVKLNKPMRGDSKKFKVYVNSGKKNKDGTIKVKKVEFGHKGKGGEKTMRIKKNNPERRKSFRARHNCDNPGPKTKARYWSCRAW